MQVDGNRSVQTSGLETMGDSLLQPSSAGPIYINTLRRRSIVYTSNRRVGDSLTLTLDKL